MNLQRTIAALEPELIELRHYFHQIPEVGLDLPKTAARVQQEISLLGLECHAAKSVTGFMAVLRGTKPDTGDEPDAATDNASASRPLVLLRADMDGLPVKENTGLPYAATNGAMHACGHDVHLSALIGAMRGLVKHRNELAGDVVFMFQPGEESKDGAGHMLSEGLLEAAGKLPDHAYAAHVLSAGVPSGVIGSRAGTLFSSNDVLQIKIIGRGGHGSAPHQTLDPVPVAAEIITQVQVLVAREVDIFDPAVVSCGYIRAGEGAPNVIPDQVEMAYTIRTFSAPTRDKILPRISELAAGVASAHQLTCEIKQTQAYPVTINDTAEVDYAEQIIGDLYPGAWQRFESPLSPAEDFSRVLQQVPGCYVVISGVEPGEDAAQLPPNHSPQAHYSDAAVTRQAQVLAALAYGRLA